MRDGAEVGAYTDDDHQPMRTTYAVTWQKPGEAGHSGCLELQSRGLVFEGSNGVNSASEMIPYEDVSEVRIARSPEDRLSGRQTLVLEQRNGGPIRIAGIVHTGIVAELADRLASRHLPDESSLSRVVLVLPLVEGATERVAELLRKGPPFDPDEVGLGRHEVFLTESEAIFLFEADSPQAADRLLSGSRVWAAATAWKDLVAGPPRIAEDAYSWVRAPEPADYVSFDPTPGPGDSEGGDIF
jgi:hypothetical protein